MLHEFGKCRSNFLGAFYIYFSLVFNILGVFSIKKINVITRAGYGVMIGNSDPSREDLLLVHSILNIHVRSPS